MRPINHLLFLIIVSSIFSCKKYDDEFIGPALGIAPDDFAVTGNSFSASKANPDFSADSIYFQATFNASVTWSILLKGELSGAEKTIKGLSNAIDVSNSTWSGTTDIAKLFRSEEKVTATLSVYGWKDSLSTSLTISQSKHHGIVLGRFEGISPDPSGNFSDQGLYWFSSFDSPQEKEFMNKIFDADAPEGNYCIQLKGHDANGNYYIGKAGLSSSAPFTFNFGTTDPSALYYNLYVKGQGAGANVKLVIETFEDDNSDGFVGYDNTEDKYSATIDVGFDGWKLVSVKYSDFAMESSGTDGNKNPEKIHLIGYYFGPKNSSSASLTVLFDYPTMTVGGPMIP